MELKKVKEFILKKDQVKEFKHKRFGLTVRFFVDKIEIFETKTKSPVAIYPFDGLHASVLKKPTVDEYVIRYNDKTYQFLTLVRHKVLSEYQTKSEYILNIDFRGEDFGFYFGLYEVGKFKIINGSKLEISDTYKIHFVDKGWAINKDTVILSFRNHMNRDTDSKTYSIKIYRWLDNAKPEKILELEPTYSLNALTQISDEIVAFGYLNGFFELFSIKNMEVMKSKKIFDSGFAYMILEDNKIYCTSMKGEIACLTVDGEILWKKILDDSPIYNIQLKQEKLYVISSKKMYCTINPITGETLHQEEFKNDICASFSSNFIFHEDSILISGEADIYSISKVGIKTIFHGSDPLIRVLQSTSRGYMTGDDDGKLKLWHYSNFKLSKRRHAILLT